MHTAEGQEELSDSPNSDKMPDQETTKAGIFVFSHSMDLLLATRRALELTGQVRPADTAPFTFVLPAPVKELCTKIHGELKRRSAADHLKPFEAAPTICEFGRPTLLTGIGLPDHGSIEQSRILIILKEHSGSLPDQMSQLSQLHMFRDAAA